MIQVSKNKIHELMDIIKKNNDLEEILKYSYKRGNSLLHVLINEGDIDGFRSMMCIIKKINKTNKCLVKKVINIQNKAGDTPAHIAVRKSKNENNIYSIMVELLQSVGADFTISNNNNEVIVQSGVPQYDENDTKEHKYINSCVLDEDDDNDNETTENLDDIQTTSSPTEFPFPLKLNKLDILIIDQKQNQKQNQNPFYEQLQQQFNQKQNPFYEQLQQQFNQNKNQNQLEEQLKRQFQQFNQRGGKTRSISDSVSISDSNSDSDSKSESDMMFKGKRKINNPYISMDGGSKISMDDGSKISMDGGSKISDKNHNDAILKIRDLGYTIEEAKDVKNMLYYEIKDNFPGLNNDQRSAKFAEVIETFKMMDIKKVRKELEKYRERNNKNTPPKKEHSKEHSKEPKKEKKEKKSSKRTSSKKKSSKRTSSKKKSSKRSYK